VFFWQAQVSHHPGLPRAQIDADPLGLVVSTQILAQTVLHQASFKTKRNLGTKQPTNQKTNQPANQPASQPAHQPDSQPSNQPPNQPTNQPSNQPINQIGRAHV
jgi:single-stranded DNA-binding protein